MDMKLISKLEFNTIRSKLEEMTTSVPGREIAGSLMPSPDEGEVRDMLKETGDGVNYLVKKGSPPLGGIRDIRDSLKRVSMGGILNTGELLKISDVLRASRNLKSYIREDITLDDGNTVTGLVNLLMTNKPLENRISTCISGEGEISDNASSELRTIRRRIRDMQAGIKEKLDSMIRSPRMQKYMQESIVTLREDRYVVPVKSEYRNEVKGLIHDASSSGATIYIEPAAVVEANNRIKQQRIREMKEIERILQELTSGVCAVLDGIQSNLKILARIDFIFAKAKLSLEFQCCCPALNTKGAISIKKGRHPLLKKEEVVPVDLWIGTEFKSLVITGPNTGGKTVTLKTVGLFTLMTQAGLHIPAGEGTEMCVFNSVFADIGDEQSIEQSLSTFSSHMTNIVNILKKADDRSLVLLDELGAGTDPAEGAALAMSIIESLYNRGATTISTTHYSELKLYAVSTPGVENASCEFDIKSLRPTYRLLIGVPGKSNAFAISERLGLDRGVLERAADFLTQEDIRFEDIITSLEQDRSKTRTEREKAEALRKEAEELKTGLDKKWARMDKQRDRLMREAREEARGILTDAKSKSEGILKSLIEMKQKHDMETVDIKEAKKLRMELNNNIDSLEKSLSIKKSKPRETRKLPKSLKPGDRVVICDLNQEGTVISGPDKNGEVSVQTGAMKISVNMSELEISDNRGTGETKGGWSGISGEKVATASTEIDVRGNTVEEAEILIDKFMDDASLAGLKEVTIIHGKGSGALRSGLHSYLKSNPHVKTFRLGEYGEGDSGVTVAKLK